MMKITLTKIMWAIIATLIITNVHLYKSRGNALEKAGAIQQQLEHSQQQTKDAVALSNQNTERLLEVIRQREAAEAQISVLNGQINAQKSATETQIIEVTKYVERAEGFEKECLNMRLPESILSPLRVRQ